MQMEALLESARDGLGHPSVSIFVFDFDAHLHRGGSIAGLGVVERAERAGAVGFCQAVGFACEIDPKLFDLPHGDHHAIFNHGLEGVGALWVGRDPVDRPHHAGVA